MNVFDNIEVSTIGRRFEFAVPLDFDQTTFNVIGEKLSMKVNDVTEEQLKVLQTGFDAGFGERNSYGFGFMMKRVTND